MTQRRRGFGPGVISRYGKALASGAVSLAAYLAGVIPAEGGFGDVSLGQWMLAIVAVGAAFGITAAVPKGDELARLDSHGIVRAGPAASMTTNKAMGAGTSVGELVQPAQPEGIGA
jgi:hypothetical protein